MIKVTFEFPNVETAIANLGTMMAGQTGSAADRAPGTPAKSGNAPGVAGSKPAPSAPATKQRKARADAGKPRGPHKEAGVAGAGAQPSAPAQASAAPGGNTAEMAAAPAAEASAPNLFSEPAAQAPAGSAAEIAGGDATQAASAAAAPIDDATVHKWTEQIFAKFEGEATLAFIEQYGVKRSRDLPQAMRAKYIADAKAKLEAA